MAYTAGFAQVVVTPSFKGFNQTVGRQINNTFPAAGRTAAQQMGTGFQQQMTQRQGLFSRTMQRVTGGLSGLFAGAGATGGGGFVARARSAIASGATRLHGAMSGIGARISTALSGFGTTAGSGFLSSFTRAVGPLAALFGVGSVVSSGFGRLTGIEDARASLVGLGHDAATVQQIMDNAMEAVKGTPYALQDAVKAATGLVAAGVKPGEALSAELARIADAATIANIPLSDMSAIWNKVAASGRIQGEELAQLGDRGIPILQLLSDHLGVTVDEVRTLASQGKVSFEDFSEAMHAGMGGAAQEAANTTTGAFANMKAALGRLGAGLLESLGFDNLKDLIGSVTERLDGITKWVGDNQTLLSSLAGGFGGVALAAGAVGLAIKGVTAAFTALGKHPIIMILGALASLFIYLWQTNEDFRNGVTAAWDNIKAAVSAAWEVVQPVLQSLWSWVQESLIPAVLGFWNNAVKPAFSAIANAIKSAWNGAIKPAFNAIQNFIRNVLAPAFQWLYRNVIEPVWKGIRFAIEVAWNVIKLIFDAVKWYLNNVLGPVFTWLRDKVITPVWNGIRDTISNVWNNRIKPVLDAVGKFVRNTVAPGFEKGVDRIRDIWNGLRAVAAKPINFVIETVYNDGIKKVFDNVAKAIGSDARLPRATPIPAYAKGGLAAPGWALVGEEGPELVNFDRPGRVYTAKETAEVLDRMAGSRPSEALLPMGGSVWDNIGSWVSNTWRSVTDWVRGSLADAANKILDPLRTTIRNNVPNVGLGTMVRGAALNTIDNLVKWVRGKDDEALADGSAEYTGRISGWRRPSLGRITSLFGPRWGSFHNGVDFAGAPGRRVLAAADGLVRRVGWNVGYGNTGIGVLVSHGNGLESYYGHAPSLGAVRVRPGDTVKAGQWISQEGATGFATGPHLHFSLFRRGKALNPLSFIGGGGSSSAPRVYDNGGWLAPGLQAVANYTRQPEAVLTARQWDAISALAGSAATGGDVYHIEHVDLSTESIRSLEDFANSLRRRVRQK